MIGGFGNLKGDIDFWDLEKLQEVANSKSYCAVATEWFPDGTNFFTAVLYERVKVDNEFRAISASGKLVHHHDLKANQLNYASYRPTPVEEVKRPDIAAIYALKEQATKEEGSKEEEKKEAPKPKKLWRAPQSTAFSQLMKEEMSGNFN